MALVPRSRWFRDWWDDIDRWHRDIDDHFRQITVRDDDWWRWPRRFPWYRESLWPWRNTFKHLDRDVGAATVDCNDDRYRIVVDVQLFSPEEIIVRTDDKYITIEAKHEEAKKDGWGSFVAREFFRRYLLPRGYDIGNVKPSLSSDGYLTITAPRLALAPPGDRILPIRRTYLPAIKA